MQPTTSTPGLSCSFCQRPPAPGGRAWRGARATICLACVEVGLRRAIDALGGVTPPPGAARPCAFCDQSAPPHKRLDAGDATICGECLTSGLRGLVGRPPAEERRKAALVVDLLQAHFEGHDLESLATQVRTFPARMRADVQTALDELLAGAAPVGLRAQYSHETVDVPALVARGHHPVQVAPLQFIEVDVGEEAPRRCLRTGLWLLARDGVRLAVLLSSAEKYGQSHGLHVEVATPAGEAGARAAQAVLSAVEAGVRGARSYRGKVLSLEQERDYGGRVIGVKVHRLRGVTREDVILPERTLALLERNVFGFHAQRAELRRLGLPVKKGLLFHGPPGTGKTHTIHYLASRLEGHTTLLITAEQVGHLDEYLTLARLLQPSVVVVEDADLIARERTQMGSPCEEVLLNKLLNEMDGLREDAEVLFVLTTNRPDTLEPALAARPGRIDQAIEFPLPDVDGRRKLVRLYARGLDVDEALVDTLARRTERASAAFIKELMRRTAQAALERGAGGAVTLAHAEAALEEMLLSGGRLNLKLLGGEVGAEAAQ